MTSFDVTHKGLIMNDTPKKIEPAEKRISFLKKHELAALLRKVDKQTDKAVDTLSEILENEETDTKTKVDVSKFLLELRVKIGTEVARDQLQRTIAEVRLVNDMSKPKTKNINDEGGEDFEGDDPSIPVVDFSLIKSTKV